MNNHLINHVVFVIDKSSSMHPYMNDVVRVFDTQIAFLSKRSQELDQETRVSIYLFAGAGSTDCVVYDRDVMRLPSLRNLYKPYGYTALIDGSLTAIRELKLTPEIHGDHAFLVYAITDGHENASLSSGSELRKVISGLSENWTVAAMVPDEDSLDHVVRIGFPKNNIQLWDIVADGVDFVGDKIRGATEVWFNARATGVRGSTNLFKVDVASIDTAAVKSALTPLPARSYKILDVTKDVMISPFVEAKLGSYHRGSAFYQLTKKETIQPTKEIIVRSKATGRLFGGLTARKLLGLPNYNIDLIPSDVAYADYEVYVQSTSVNRKLIGGTKLIVKV